ncbi:MAG TPA: extracellular solute-binding protein [Candidatus Limiplasma pullicola]|nr:extracellular solute-binding protein [Candidatus Limiplasma pullicola]
MKKGVALLLVLAMMLSFCAVGASAEEQVTITFGFWGDTPEANMKMQLAENYMAMHPNVNIEFEYTDGNGYLTKMQTWFSSGTTPDVFGVASDVLTYFINQDEFENLAPYIEADGLEGSWNQNIIDSSYTNAKGEIVAIPFISKVFAMAYNKDLFDEAGIDYPTDDWTIDDMLEAARAIT